MRKLLLSLGLVLGLALPAYTPAYAQTPCVGVNGVNAFPQPGVVCAQEPAVNTYVASGVGMVPAASATDLVCLDGAANIAIRLQRVAISGSAGTAIGLPFLLTKNAALDTPGTQNTGTALPVAYAADSATTSAAKASFQSNTTNPTINDTGPGIIAVRQINLPTTAAGSGSQVNVIDWNASRYAEAPTLRTAAQQICVNLNAVSVSSGKVNVDWYWTEASQ